MQDTVRIPGILGGAGPGATAQLYLDLVRRCRKAGLPHRPAILIASLEIDLTMEQQLLQAGTGVDGYFDSLLHSSRALVSAGADFLAIPCNTLHIHIPDLSLKLPIKVLSIVEAVARQIDSCGCKTVGLLATRMTGASRMYQDGLQNLGYQVVELPLDLQLELEQQILAEVEQARSASGSQLSRRVAETLGEFGAEIIIAGCTELKTLMADWDLPWPVIDSLDALGALIVQEMLRDHHRS